MNQRYSIQEVADKTGLSAHTLRYYERIGLIDSVSRADNGHREYSPDDLGWIEFLKKLRTTGMPIRTMQRYAALQAEGEHTVFERLAILREHRDKIKADLDELMQYLDVIEYKVQFYQQVVAQYERELEAGRLEHEPA
jgi:DNA-binding transcriptional MerR regulator